MQLISIDFSQINQSQQKMYFCYNRLYIRFNLNSVKSKYNNSHKKLENKKLLKIGLLKEV
jgi:hypothetical protein